MTDADRPRLRVALATAPTLLADSLRVLLDDAADVTILLAETDESFDLAVTMPGAPRVRADLVIDLDDSPAGAGGGTVRCSPARESRRLDDLAAVVAYVRAAADGRPDAV